MNHKIFYGGKKSTKHGVLAVWFAIIYHGENMSEKEFKSPMVSCICCREVKSAKGIFTHFLISHVEGGKDRLKKAYETSKTAIKLARDKKKEFEDAKRHLEKVEYGLNPKKCEICDCAIPYERKNNSYCSRSCGSIAGNKKRSDSGWKRTEESKLKTKQSIESKKTVCELIPSNCSQCGIFFFNRVGYKFKKTCGKSCSAKTRTCVGCGLVETTTSIFFNDCCSFCDDSLMYRRKCEFKFNLKDYPNEFDFDLLTTHGMFHPRKNPKGVSRDHMLSVQYGKDNRIDPKIISHPANCVLMLQSENTKKKSDSSITYEQLIERIRDWDDRYN